MNESLSLAEALANFHFLRPLWLLALVPAIWLLRNLWRHNESGSAWHKAIDPELLPYILDRSRSKAQRLPLVLLACVWMLATLAMAGPTWTQVQYPAQQRQDALVVVLDQSVGMFATDIEPNRQTAARRKLTDLLEQRREGQTALIVYSAQAHMVSPLTEDTAPIKNMVPALSPNIMPAFGNNAAHGIEMALELLRDSGRDRGRILLLSGGMPADQPGAIRQLLEDSPYPLSIIGIGTEAGAPIPASEGDFLRDDRGNMVIPELGRSALQNLASDGGGRYHDLSVNSSDLDFVLADSLLGGEGDYMESLQEFDVWADAGPWLVLLLLPLGALIFRRGWLLGMVLGSSLFVTMLVPSGPTHAQDLRSIWQTRDQQGARAFEEDDHERAANLFQSPAWRGTAHYRAGNYEAAIQDFAAQGESPDALYNMGTAMAHAGLYEEAIAVYDAVLDMDPEHSDARHNKEILEQLLQDQEQEQQQEQDTEDGDESADPDQQQDDESEQEPDEEEGQDEQEMDQDTEESDQDQESQEQQADEDGSQDQQQDISIEEEEDQESLEQWLRRIDDDPGELLQRKFQFEYRRRQIEARAAGQQL